MEPLVNERSDIRTITKRVANSNISNSNDGGNVSVHDSPNSLLSETQRRIIEITGGERGKSLERTLTINAIAFERERTNANRIAAAVRFDVEEYLGLLEARFAGEFRQIGRELRKAILKARK